MQKKRRRADETAKELRASLHQTFLLMRVHHGPMMKGRSGLCSLRCRFESPKMVTTIIRRVITERLNEQFEKRLVSSSAQTSKRPDSRLEVSMPPVVEGSMSENVLWFLQCVLGGSRFHQVVCLFSPFCHVPLFCYATLSSYFPHSVRTQVIERDFFLEPL